MAGQGCIVTPCDLAYIRCCSLEAFQGMCSAISGAAEYIRFDRTATDAVPQNALADLFDEVNAPVYVAGVPLAAWWTDVITAEIITKHGFETKPDVMMQLSIPWMEDNGAISIEMEDRILVKYPTEDILYEIMKRHIPRNMGNLTLAMELFLKTVD